MGEREGGREYQREGGMEGGRDDRRDVHVGVDEWKNLFQSGILDERDWGE